MWAWNASLQAWAKHPEVFWTIGYRGAGDEPAQCYGPCTLKDKAEHVSWALGNQSNLLRAFVPDGKKFTWLWDEGLAYLKSGALTIPNDTVVVFTDSGDGNVEGLEYAHGGAGIYTHGEVCVHESV